jgi:putative hemolysin
MDEFDLRCDHLIIQDAASREVIGTYRVNASTYSRNFYSNKEFHLDNFLRSPGCKLELGRACIHKDYRNGRVLSLLWKGIVMYSERVGAEKYSAARAFKPPTLMRPFRSACISKTTDTL